MKKINTIYILYCIAQFYGHPCPETSFININSVKLENA